MKCQNIILHFFVFAILSNIATFAQTPQDLQKAKEFYEVGNLEINRGDFQKAIENYTKAINLYPHVPEFFFNRAIAYKSIRLYEQAISDLDKILELNPSLPIPLWAEFYLLRGTTLQENEMYDESLDNLNKAISLNSTDARYFANRGNTYSFLKKHDLAFADYNKSLEITPYPLTYYNRARLYDEKGEFDHAIDDYTKAIQLSPKFAEAYNNRGLSYQKKGNFDLALQDFTKAISLDEKDGMYYFNRANIYFQKGRLSSSIADYTKVIEIYPLWADAFLRRANVYKKQGRDKLAEADLQKAKKVEKENFNPVNKTEILNP